MAQRKEELDEVVVGRDGRVVSKQEREAIRERFWRAVEELWALNADKDPDEVLRDVTGVVEEVRRERYERELRAQGGH
jgi:hypothetical protein